MSSEAHYDLVVIGGGPAGCSAAIVAKRRSPTARVLLLEKGSYPRHKVCGEFISPEALEVLGTLLGEEQPVMAKPLPIYNARMWIGNSQVELPLQPPAVSLPRYDLDALLWAAAQAAGVDCISQASVQEVRGNHPWHVLAGSREFATRAVIDATGRWSNLSPKPAIGPREKWIGLKAHFAEEGPESSVDLYFFAGGYCGVQPVSPGAINACAMVRADVASDLKTVFSLNPSLAERSQSWTPITQTVATSPLLFQPPRATRDGLLLAGDAAGFIDPFLGDGISLALRSGTLAGQTIAPFLQGTIDLEAAVATYADAYHRELAPAFSRAAMLRRLLSLPRALRGPLVQLASVPGVAKFLFRKTRQTAVA